MESRLQSLGKSGSPPPPAQNPPRHSVDNLSASPIRVPPDQSLTRRCIVHRHRRVLVWRICGDVGWLVPKQEGMKPRAASSTDHMHEMQEYPRVLVIDPEMSAMITKARMDFRRCEPAAG